MRGDAASMTVLAPRSAAEAVRLLAKNPGAVPLAGGTDLMVGWNMGLLNGRTVVDLARIGEWKKIKASKGSVLIGSLATHSEIQKHPVVRSRHGKAVSPWGVEQLLQIHQMIGVPENSLDRAVDLRIRARCQRRRPNERAQAQPQQEACQRQAPAAAPLGQKQGRAADALFHPRTQRREFAVPGQQHAGSAGARRQIVIHISAAEWREEER